MTMTASAGSGWVPGWCRPGGYQGGLYRGSTPSHLLARGRPISQRSGPVRLLQGAWSGGDMGLDACRRRCSWVPPCGPGQACCPPCTQDPLNAASWPIRARFRPLYTKLSENREVSPKYVDKACLSPYSQNGSQKSPLRFLRFPYLVAFSHKELMGLFYPYLILYCQNDEVSPECHPMCTLRYPHGHRQQAGYW